MKKLQLSFGFELDEVNPNLEEYINNLQTSLTDFFVVSGAKVIDSKFNVEELTHHTQNKAITGDLFPDYTIYPLNINGSVLRTQIHKDNQRNGIDYPTLYLIEEIISLNLPLYKQQDLIKEVFFYHRCIFVSYTRYGRPDFTVFYNGKTTRFKSLNLIHKFIDNHIV